MAYISLLKSIVASDTQIIGQISEANLSEAFFGGL